MLGRQGTVGINTHVTQVADILAKNGQRSRVTTPESWAPTVGRALRAPDRVLRRVGSEGAVRVNRYVHRRRLQLALRREVQRNVPALIYAQDPRSAFTSLKVRGASDFPIVMVVHYNESQAEELVERQMISRGGRTDTAIRSFEAQLIPRLDGLVFVSEFMRLHLQAQLPEVRKIPSVVIPNFLESKPIISVDERLADCISVGSLVERKNHAYLLRVLASARRAGHRYTLTLVGDGPERSPLQRLAEELGVTDQVSFAGRRHDVDSLLSRHRLYVHSSTMENCPFALIEAFRSGLPVVAAAVGGIPEVIGKDGAGRFWDLADPEAGAQVLSDFLEDRVAMQRAARNARSRFEEAFDAVVVGQRLVQFLDGVRMGRKP